LPEEFGPHKEIINSVYQISPEAIEQLAQVLEQRGLRTPVGQVVGYQRERFVCSVQLANAQSIPDSTQTAVSFDTTRSDSQKAFNGTDTITLPYNGVYLVQTWVLWNTSATGERDQIITQNGVSRATDVRSASPGNGQGALSAVILGGKGNTIKHQVFQTSGGALNLNNADFSVALISAY